MAKLIKALALYRPRIVQKGIISTQNVIEDLAQLSALSKGDVASFLQDLSDTVLRYLRSGHSVDVDGIGRFHLSVDTVGKIKLNILDDPNIENSLNTPDGFEGEIMNKDLIGEGNAKVIEKWNTEHPDDPIEG